MGTFGASIPQSLWESLVQTLGSLVTKRLFKSHIDNRLVLRIWTPLSHKVLSRIAQKAKNIAHLENCKILLYKNLNSWHFPEIFLKIDFCTPSVTTKNAIIFLHFRLVHFFAHFEENNRAKQSNIWARKNLCFPLLFDTVTFCLQVKLQACWTEKQLSHRKSLISRVAIFTTHEPFFA